MVRILKRRKRRKKEKIFNVNIIQFTLFRRKNTIYKFQYEQCTFDFDEFVGAVKRR
jgi:hypothetical protein